MADQDPAPEGQDNPERPEWLPDNFKTPEDLAKSYTESQRKITELSTQNKGLEESIGELSQQFAAFTAEQAQPDQQTVYSQWQDMYDQDPIGTMAQIAQATAQQTIKQFQQQQPEKPGVDPSEYSAFVANQTLAAKYGDEWDEYRGRVLETIGSDPIFNNDAIWTNPGLTTQALERALEMEKAKDVLAGNTVVQQQMADTRQMKLAAQSAVGASGRPDPTSASAEEWAAIKAARPNTYY